MLTGRRWTPHGHELRNAVSRPVRVLLGSWRWVTNAVTDPITLRSLALADFGGSLRNAVL